MVWTGKYGVYININIFQYVNFFYVCSQGMSVFSFVDVHSKLFCFGPWFGQIWAGKVPKQTPTRAAVKRLFGFPWQSLSNLTQPDWQLIFGLC